MKMWRVLLGSSLSGNAILWIAPSIFIEVLESQHALFTDLIMKNYLIGNWKWRRWFPQRVHEKTYARNGWSLCYQQKTFWSCFWLNQRGPVSSHSRSPRLVLKYNVKTVVEKRQDRSKSRIAKVKEFLYHIRNSSIK